MKASFTQIGGLTVFVSRDDGCSTTVDPQCSEAVVAFVVGRTALHACDVAIVPKCQKHLDELPEQLTKFVIPVRKRADIEEALNRR